MRVLVANRGEIACRVMRSCHALGFDSVAVYSEVDVNAAHVAMAHDAVAIGAAPPKDSYLSIENILRAAKSTAAEAVHPGYGFLSENAAFAQAVEDAGLLWIGPSPRSIIDMGDKERARSIASSSGVPVLPGSRRFAMPEVEGGDDAFSRSVAAAAHAVGFPLLVKASAGGGGIGMRRVDRPEDLLPAVTATQSMALRAFGDAAIYLERYVPVARHVEIQVFGFGDGRAIHLFERDCSIQRRFQKIIEESPAPGLHAETRAAMAAAATALACQQRYRGAGTVEFIVDAETQDFYFLEMNTRIQVEHPVTEMVTGIDLVGMQLQLAGAFDLPVSAQESLASRGHAIECRLYAERPGKNFLPSVGTLRTFQLPRSSDTLRVDAGVREGDSVTPHYDPMLAKIIAHGESRDDAIEILSNALRQVVVEGIETNAGFLLGILSHPTFRAGMVSTSFVDDHKSELLKAP